MTAAVNYVRSVVVMVMMDGVTSDGRAPRLGVFSLHLRGCGGQEVDIEGVVVRLQGIRTSASASGAGIQRGWRIDAIRRVRVGWGDVGRTHVGCWSGLRDGGPGRRHQLCLGSRVILRVACHGGHGVILVTPSRVRIVVDAGMPGQLVGPAEAFGAAGKGAPVRLLARMCPDVSGLVF